MKILKYTMALLFVSLILNSCKKDPSSFLIETPYVYDLPEGVPLPNIPEKKKLTLEKIALGKKLFYDTRLSRDESIACVSCHLQNRAFADNLPISVGIEGRVGFRNSPTLVNVAYHPYFFKEGGNSSLEGQAFGPIEHEAEMDFSGKEIIERLAEDEEIQMMSKVAFGRTFDNYVLVNSLGAFERTITSFDSPYDRFFYKKEENALNENEKRGMQLFFSDQVNCSKCHSGIDFNNYEIVNNGAFDSYENDKGYYRISEDSADIGKFKTATLRNIALTYPYMHNGAFKTLEDVIEHYDKGGSNHVNQHELIKPLNLTTQQKADLIAFLNSLTDTTLLSNEAYMAD